MTVRQTSIDAYASTPRTTQRAIVLDCIRQSPATRDEVAERTGIAIHVVAARVTALLANEDVHETADRRRTRAGQMAAVLAVGPAVTGQMSVFDLEGA